MKKVDILLGVIILLFFLSCFLIYDTYQMIKVLGMSEEELLAENGWEKIYENGGCYIIKGDKKTPYCGVGCPCKADIIEMRFGGKK